MNFGSKNSAIGIILGLNLIFFAVWVITLFVSVQHSAYVEAANKLMGVFMGVNNALMLILNTEAKNSDSHPQNPTQPQAGPTQK